MVDGRHIVVGNDNKLLFSRSGTPHQGNDNEPALLEVGDFLKAR